jgi:hypothetical protein
MEGEAEAKKKKASDQLDHALEAGRAPVPSAANAQAPDGATPASTVVSKSRKPTAAKKKVVLDGGDGTGTDAGSSSGAGAKRKRASGA